MNRRGFTLVELILAIGLLSILFVVVVRLVDTSLGILNRTESNRDLVEVGGSVLDLLANDVQALDGGPRGDVVGEWVRFDVDRDGSPTMLWPRLRLVRQVSAVELSRLAPGEAVDPRTRGLIEICWALLPAEGVEPDERSIGVLWRGERLLGDEDWISFFDERFFDAVNRPPPGSLHEVTGGVLYLEPWYAAQTTTLYGGWKLGDDIADCAASWDAWDRERPDLELTFLNQPAAGMPVAKDLPLLPRRIRFALELERPQDLKRRTRLTDEVEPETPVLTVVDETRLPPDGELVLIDEEWIRIVSRSKGRAAVQRGQRGTRVAPHPKGALLHFGSRVVREVPVAMMREDWDL